jgi:hypothetical protein
MDLEIWVTFPFTPFARNYMATRMLARSGSNVAQLLHVRAWSKDSSLSQRMVFPSARRTSLAKAKRLAVSSLIGEDR